MISVAIPPFVVARRVLELLSERSLSAINSASDAGTDCVSAIATTITIVKMIYHFSLGKLRGCILEIYVCMYCCLVEAGKFFTYGYPSAGIIFRGVDEPFSETLLLEVCGLFDAMAVWDEGLPGSLIA